MKRHLGFGIKAKFVTVAALIVGIASVVGGGWFLKTAKTLLFKNLISDGRLLLTSMKAPVIASILNSELESAVGHGSLDNIIEEIANNSECRTDFAFVVDTKGMVIAHNRMAEYGKVYHDPLIAAAMAKDTLQQRIVGARESEKAVLQMIMPLSIYGKKWGALCVGLSMQPLHQQELELRRTIVTFSFLLFLAGTAVFYGAGLTLTMPLKNLSAAMAEVTSDTLEAELPAMRRDEIGQLQKSFTAMIERLKQSETERQRAVNSLIQSEKLATIGKLVTGVAHEVNNPLAAMTSCIYNLEQRVLAVDRDDLEILKQGCSRIGTIVRQLSDFSRAGTLLIEPVRSSDFFGEMIAFARMALQSRCLELKSQDSCNPPLLLPIDRGKLHQVALDLLMNAADASPPLATIEISAYVQKNSYCLAVKDQGTGIAEHLQEKIFEPFYSLKPPGKGSGIGLAVCKTIIDLHRGTIAVASKPGETLFTVMIPINEEAEHGHHQSAFG